MRSLDGTSKVKSSSWWTSRKIVAGVPTICIFLPERRIYGPIAAAQEHGEIEDSPVWNSLSTQFAASVGKIRVFCAPDIVAICTEGLHRPEIEGALEAATALIIP